MTSGDSRSAAFRRYGVLWQVRPASRCRDQGKLPGAHPSEARPGAAAQTRAAPRELSQSVAPPASPPARPGTWPEARPGAGVQARPGARLAARLRNALLAAAAALLAAGPALADRGPVTNLPMPRYVSLKGSEGNARRGPSTAHRIDWVFVRRDMPLQVIGEYDNWRQVRDREGATGWMHYAMLSGVRTVIIETDLVPLRSSPQDGGAVVAHLEAGVIARLQDCSRDWCRVQVDGYRGWLRKAALWGVTPEEERD